MRFPKKGEQDSIIYNHHITISNIPAEAYEYTVNGKSAIEWAMERYRITVDKNNGIKNDPNDWAAEVYFGSGQDFPSRQYVGTKTWKVYRTT
jgi:predicted helicase